MITLLSPSKGQDFTTPAGAACHSQPELLDNTQLLVKELRRYDCAGLQELMSISAKIAELNVGRFNSFALPFTPENSKQALCAFTGDVYGAMAVEQYGVEDYEFAQKHLRILSGLYGCLRPLDLIQPYRLEMKTKLANKRGKDLYTFWGGQITDAINAALADHEHKTVINLASAEYFKAVDKKRLAGELLTINFKESKAGKARVIAIYAKRARGMMADYIIRRKIDEPEKLQKFDLGGYCYEPEMSDLGQFTFVRPQPG